MAKRDQLLAEHGDEVELEQWQTRESSGLSCAKRAGVSARQLAHQYSLEELRGYLAQSARH